jgi:AcrR family transcriptional regulator
MAETTGGPGVKKRRVDKSDVYDAALRKFHVMGYHATSMRDIAALGDFNVASIYNHFASKQALLRAIMVETMEDVLATTAEALERSEATPTAQLSALMRTWVIFHTRRRPEALVSATEMRSLEPDNRAEVVALRDRQQRMFYEVIEHGVQTGEFATRYPVEATRAILTMGATIATWYRPDGGQSPEELAKSYEDLALGVVRGPMCDGHDS